MLIRDGLGSGRARAWLRALEALKVVLELALVRRDVFSGAAGVRSRSRRHLVADRLEVPRERLKAHGRGGLQAG